MAETRTRPHPKEAAILAALHAGGSNKGIARELHVDPVAVGRIRRAHGIQDFDTAHRAARPSVEQLWQRHARVLEDGHVQWTGPRANGSNTPALRHRGSWYSALAIAFRMASGREPNGQVKAECTVTGCVAPACVEDESGRQDLRRTLRLIKGMPELPTTGTCRRGHDRARYGRIGPDLYPYCEGCKQDHKRAKTT